MDSLNLLPSELGDILSQVDLTGFTHYLRWSEKRYVVAFTSNKERTPEILVAQVNYYSQFYETCTIGWRTDKYGEVMIDPGTATDDLEEALALAVRYHQQAIFDSSNGCDITVT